MNWDSSTHCSPCFALGRVCEHDGKESDTVLSFTPTKTHPCACHLTSKLESIPSFGGVKTHWLAFKWHSSLHHFGRGKVRWDRGTLKPTDTLRAQTHERGQALMLFVWSRGFAFSPSFKVAQTEYSKRLNESMLCNECPWVRLMFYRSAL